VHRIGPCATGFCGPAGSTGKSYAIPALEIMGFRLCCSTSSTGATSTLRLHTPAGRASAQSARPLGHRQRPYTVNQLGHPYQARCTTGSRGRPDSINGNRWAIRSPGRFSGRSPARTTADRRTTRSQAASQGSFVGEALFRMSQLVLETGRAVCRRPGASSPQPRFPLLRDSTVGLSANRFDAIYDSRNAAYLQSSRGRGDRRDPE
jgi:hypothetical protein